jgi:hypothetical protein
MDTALPIGVWFALTAGGRWHIWVVEVVPSCMD